MSGTGEERGGSKKPEGREAESSEGTQGQLQQQEWFFQSGIIWDRLIIMSVLLFYKQISRGQSMSSSKIRKKKKRILKLKTVIAE